MRSLLKKFTFIVLLLVSTQILCHAQGTGFVPLTFNYTTHNYNAGNQNWAVAQGEDKIIYIGNEQGLLTFDAINWELYRLPNNLSVKSILVENDADKERIYVGSIVSVLPFNDEILLFTSSNGIFSYNQETDILTPKSTHIDKWLRNERVNRAVSLSDSTFAIGTLNNGIYIVTADGELKYAINHYQRLI